MIPNRQTATCSVTALLQYFMAPTPRIRPQGTVQHQQPTPTADPDIWELKGPFTCLSDTIVLIMSHLHPRHIPEFTAAGLGSPAAHQSAPISQPINSNFCFFCTCDPSVCIFTNERVRVDGIVIDQHPDRYIPGP